MENGSHFDSFSSFQQALITYCSDNNVQYTGLDTSSFLRGTSKMEQGSQFDSFSSFQQALNTYCNDNNVQYTIVDSKSLKSVNKTAKVPYDEKFVFRFIKYQCKYGAKNKKKMTGLGIRSNRSTLDTGCTATLTASIDRDSNTFKIQSHRTVHNHELSRIIYLQHSEESDELNDQPLSTTQRMIKIKMADQSIIQPPPFGSISQADTYIRNHELSTHEKFVIKQNRTHYSQDLQSVEKCNIRWEFNLASGVYCDGIPYIIIADQLRDCQYGPSKPGEDEDEKEMKKRKRKGKKVNCPAKIWMKTIMKFPEYKVDTYDGAVRKCDKKRISQKLKREFDDDTQRFLMVFVQILSQHEHDFLLDEEPQASGRVVRNNPPVRGKWSSSMTQTPPESTQDITADTVDSEKTPKIKSKPEKKKIKVEPPKPKGEILKKGASLKGKNLMKLALDFKAREEPPYPLAQPKANKRLDNMTDIELFTLYHDLTGEMPNEMFAISGKEFSMPNMWLLLHLCIVMANAEVKTEVNLAVHQSIRMKGTEQIFTPVLCDAISCASVGEHMHCPLCSSFESYTNSSLLKKHFMQKHLHNSIEFAGLKFLRCLDGCEVDDSKAKDGHWHCWKCKLCHTKQKTCLKHFMVHLKGREEHIQVHVLQNVNPWVKAGYITHEINCMSALSTIGHDTSTDHTEATPDSGSVSPLKKYMDTPGKRHHYVVSEADQHSMVQNEQQSAVMYIQDDNIASLLSLAQDKEYVVSYNDETDIDRLRCIIRELEQKNASLEKANMIQKSRIQFLTEKTENQEKQLGEMNLRYQDLLTQFEALRKTGTTTMGTEEDKAVSTITSGADQIKRFTHGSDGTLVKDSTATTSGSNQELSSKEHLVKQNLADLKMTRSNQKKDVNKSKESTIATKSLEDIRNYLSTIKKDIENLKIAALLTNQQAYAPNNPVMYVTNPSTQLIAANQNLLLNAKNQQQAAKDKAAAAATAAETSKQGTNVGAKTDKDLSIEEESSSGSTSAVSPKQDNTVYVALKPGAKTEKLSKMEIETLVNSAMAKKDAKKSEEKPKQYIIVKKVKPSSPKESEESTIMEADNEELESKVPDETSSEKNVENAIAVLDKSMEESTIAHVENKEDNSKVPQESVAAETGENGKTFLEQVVE